MRVLALTRYGRRGASSRLRFEQFIPGLAARGIDVTLAPLLDDAFLERRYSGRGARPLAVAAAYARRATRILGGTAWDVVWLEKEAFPWIPGPLERILASYRVPYVVDFDDAWFHRYDRHPARSVRGLLSGKLDGIMRRAAVVAAGNDYIAERARRAGAPRVEIVPTVVDLARYPLATAQAPAATFTIGWIGTPLTSSYLDAIEAPLREVAASGPSRFVAVGAGPLTLPGIDWTTPPWREEGEAAAIAGFDCGVMPLPDSEWERGKCGYKLLQYMACGKPVVASPVGVNRRIVVEGENGFLAADGASWTRALNRLRDDASLRAAMGAAGRRRVEEGYALDGLLPRLAELLRSAASATGGSR